MTPLIGDGKGRYKVHVIGNSASHSSSSFGARVGTGKSTTGTALAALLGVPYVALDRLYWEPGWKETPFDEFQAKIRKALDQSDKGWVVDGSYSEKGGNMVLEECTDMIWLDPPLLLYFPRIFIRTMSRLFGSTATCSPDCPETFSEVFFSKNSILWWCLSHHWRYRKRGKARLREFGIENGTNEQRRIMRRFGGWGGKLKIWLNDVESMVAGRQKVA
ncbi:hypothetical protein BDZ94DRAFT_1321601 [Collybia nuda]|uniref:Adenylate kinase n=1 Tax=Collybia nuda TaxID=64659 RepID=A0A9P6CIU0_9AGAR|nr:hypothetical protein BDZ94DRAFT_1321601 [Collybia nuda]